VCGLDTSGSIQDPEVSMFFGEIYGILEDLRPSRVVIMYCDSKVHKVVEAVDTSDLLNIRKLGAPGGGGTDFRPVFNKITEMGLEPDALVYLTDGYGTFPKKPPS